MSNCQFASEELRNGNFSLLRNILLAQKLNVSTYEIFHMLVCWPDLTQPDQPYLA